MSPISSLRFFQFFLLGLTLALSAQSVQAYRPCVGGGFASGFYGGGFYRPIARPFGGIYTYSGFRDPFFYNNYYARDPGLSKDDRYTGAKNKGDRYLKRGNLSGAVRQYKDALDRATRFWGKDSRQAKESAQLLAKARDKFHKFGDAQHGRKFQQELGRANRSMDRGRYNEAISAYEEALHYAHTDEQARSVSALLVKAQSNLENKQFPGAYQVRTLAQAGEQAVKDGKFAEAVEAFASALTRSIRTFGASSEMTKNLTQSLTDAQSRLATGKGISTEAYAD